MLSVPVIIPIRVTGMNCGDRFGIYVMDETNLETHGTWHLGKYDHTLPGDFPKWHEAVMSRAEAMLETGQKSSLHFLLECGK